MPTITIPAGSVEYVPAPNGGIYINAVKGRSIKASIKLEDGTVRDVSLRTVVVHSPTNAGTVLEPASRKAHAAQSGEVQTLSAKVDKLAEALAMLVATQTPAKARAK